MTNLLQQLTTTDKVLLGDGAMGTALQKLGLEPGSCPESWNVSHADQVRSVTAEYVAVGSNIVETNSFGGTSYKLASFGLAEQAAELNRQAARLARQAAIAPCLVAGSVGPTGVMMQPLGDADPDDVRIAFAEQIAALAGGGADVICIETMMSLEEGLSALQAARQSCDLPVIVTFTFEKNIKGEFRTMMGLTPQKVAEELTLAGADVVGSNCGSGMENMVEIVRLMRGVTDLPLMIQPNAGLPVLEGSRTVFKEKPCDTAAGVGELVAAGVNIIGGCCGTTPDHIAAIAAELDRLGCRVQDVQ